MPITTGRRHTIRRDNGSGLRRTVSLKSSLRPDKSSSSPILPHSLANVTTDKTTTALTTTCCSSNYSGADIHARHQEEHDQLEPPTAPPPPPPPHHHHHHYGNHRSGGKHHLVRHERHYGRRDDCDKRRGDVALSSPQLQEGARQQPRQQSSWLCSSLSSPAHFSAPASGHLTTTRDQLGERARPQRASRSGGVISPLWLLLGLALVHFYCNSIIMGSLAAAAATPMATAAASETTDQRPLSSAIARQDQANLESNESWRAKPESSRDLRDARLGEKLNVNMSNVFEVIFKKRPYSRYWSVEQKWDDLFKRLMSVQGTVRQLMMKNFMRDIEYYADLSISAQCEKDLKFIQNYAKQSTNFRWLAHMFDSTGKSEPGMLTGMLAHMGHPVQCIKVRAPARASNDSFDERFFDEQTRQLGERFRGKYCLASVRPVLPQKPRLISRFSRLMNESLLSNLSYTGEPMQSLKMRARQMSVPAKDRQLIDKRRLRLDQVPFESELYEYLIAQRNFMFTLPRFMGVCYPSSCTREDIRTSIQKTLDDQHQVVDIEFECEQEETSAWDFLNTQRLVSYVLLGLITGLVFTVSLTRYILLSKLQIKRSKLDPRSRMANLLNALDMFSMDKCAGILFIKTRRASPIVDWTKVENNRSTSIDALRGFLCLVLAYSQLAVLGCLPVPFMWSKWSDAMFPFFRSLITQVFLNMTIWTEAFYLISAYLIALKCFENFRPKIGPNSGNRRESCSSNQMSLPNIFSFAIKRYVRLVPPMLAFILLNYVWPRLSNGFVFQDQAQKLMRACDTSGWTNMLLFHNHYALNETCLWPSHVSASFFQLHLLSYPLLVLCLISLWVQFNDQFDNEGKLLRRRKLLVVVLTWLSFGSMLIIGLLGALYSAWLASQEQLIVPFLIDYIDYDNYQRVIEWMVMPTHNHLTSYMVGLALAFIVIRRKARNELRQFETSAWFSSSHRAADHEAASVSSARSSSTQELQDGLTFRAPAQAHGKFHIASGPSSIVSSQPGKNDEEYDDDDDDQDDAKTDASLTRNGRSSCLLKLLKSACVSIVLVLSLVASWLWNGLGEPMSAEQTFWYVLLTKLVFCLTFAHLFHEHIATRRNSSNPWMVTRFLVPIGRMSLTLFYVSWLVTWFDLLASLHQWHPSHYFLFEKYNEIIFIALIVAMFVYGAFEGIIKRLQYANRLERVQRDQADELKCRAELEFQQQLALSSALAVVEPNAKQLQPAQLRNQQHQQQQRSMSLAAAAAAAKSGGRVKPFERFFDAPDRATAASDEQQANSAARRQSMAADKGAAQRQGAGETRDWQHQRLKDQGHARAVADHQLAPGRQSTASTATATAAAAAGAAQSSGVESHLSATYGNLSPSDRYKLNAELRANYSFASINLYETAGATGDLSNLAAHDPQASPAMSQKR